MDNKFRDSVIADVIDLVLEGLDDFGRLSLAFHYYLERILKMFALLLFSIVSAPLVHGTEDARIPENYQGVWKIVAAVDEDGSQSSSGEAGFAEKCPIEILIVGNRVIHVNNDGSSVMAHATVLTSKFDLTLDLRTGIAHDKENSPTYWNLKLEKDKLTIELAVDRYVEDPRADQTAIPSFQAIRQN